MNMLISVALIFLSFAFLGCGLAREIEANANNQRMMSLQIGMTKEQVLATMGTPHKTESYRTASGGVREFWLYRSERHSGIDDLGWHYVPVCLENGKVDGWGRNYYDKAIRVKKDITIRSGSSVSP